MNSRQGLKAQILNILKNDGEEFDITKLKYKITNRHYTIGAIKRACHHLVNRDMITVKKVAVEKDKFKKVFQIRI